MVPLQYIAAPSDIHAALMAGSRWIQLTSSSLSAVSDAELQTLIAECHVACCYLLLTDSTERCIETQADGVLLTPAAIQHIADAIPSPSGIVLQRPLPVTQAIGHTRSTLGEDSHMLLGVFVTTPDEAVAAARAGADFIQASAELAPQILAAVRDRGFTTPIVACGVTDASEIPALLDAAVNGVACHASQIPPVIIPSILHADEL